MDFLNEKARELRQGEIRAMFDQAAAMEDVISMGIGEPDMPTPELVCRAASEALRKGITHYTPNAGTMQLREAVAGYSSVSALGYDPAREIIITNGGMGALSLLFLVLLNEGDEVLIQDPQWLNYAVQVRYCGGVPVRVPTCSEDGFQMRPEAIEGLITPRTKALMINSPNNPTGGVASPAQLEAMAAVARKHDLLVISDEVYNTLFYTGEPCCSIAALEGMKERTVVINSFSKPYAMTGWRLGYCLADAPIRDRMQIFHQYAVVSAPAFVQPACVAALESSTAPMTELFRKRRDYVYQRLTDMDLEVQKPEGAFYMFINIKKYGMDSLAFCENMLKKGLVGLIPGVYFGTEGYMRLSYCYSDEDLKEGLDRVERFLKTL